MPASVEVARRPGPGESTTRSGESVVAGVGGEAGAQRDDLGAGLAQVVGQRVHERILVVDEQDALARARARRAAAAGATRRRLAAAGWRRGTPTP